MISAKLVCLLFYFPMKQNKEVTRGTSCTTPFKALRYKGRGGVSMLPSGDKYKQLVSGPTFARWGCRMVGFLCLRCLLGDCTSLY